MLRKQNNGRRKCCCREYYGYEQYETREKRKPDDVINPARVSEGLAQKQIKKRTRQKSKDRVSLASLQEKTDTLMKQKDMRGNLQFGNISQRAGKLAKDNPTADMVSPGHVHPSMKEMVYCQATAVPQPTERSIAASQASLKDFGTLLQFRFNEVHSIQIFHGKRKTLKALHLPNVVQAFQASPWQR